MNSQIALESITGNVQAPVVPPSQGSLNPSIPGSLAKHIGSGEHAQVSIVYITILWSFIGGGAISAASIIIALFRDSTSPLAEIKDVWSVFVPLITLALGYLFGKGR